MLDKLVKPSIEQKGFLGLYRDTYGIGSMVTATKERIALELEDIVGLWSIQI